MAKTLTRDDILASPLRTEEVFVEEWNGSIFIKELTAGQVSKNSKRILNKDGTPDYGKAAELAIEIVASQSIDEDGNRLFTLADTNRLGNLHGSAIQNIAERIRQLSGLGETDEFELLSSWLEESYPQVLKEFRDDHDPIKAAERNFTATGNGDLHSD